MNECNIVDKIAFSQPLPGKAGSEYTTATIDFAIFSWYQLTYSKMRVLDRNHGQGNRNMVKSMRISKEFKSVQVTSTFSLGKCTY